MNVTSSGKRNVQKRQRNQSQDKFILQKQSGVKVARGGERNLSPFVGDGKMRDSRPPGKR